MIRCMFFPPPAKRSGLCFRFWVNSLFFCSPKGENKHYNYTLHRSTTTSFTNTILNMGMNNDAIDDRRQLLVKVSSLIKSWRISRDNLNTGYSGDENDENVKPLRRGRRKQKRKLSVMFDDELSAVPSYYDGPMSCQEIEDRWYEVRYNALCRSRQTILQNMFGD